MKFKLPLIAVVLFVLISCEVNQSAEIDLISGISSKGDGLSSSEIYLSINEEKISRTTFTYGEVYKINFRNIAGFVKENGLVFPGMELLILEKNGDTTLYYKDMYADKADGIELDPLYLYADITVADPMKSGKEYTLYVNIWDKKGTGTFKTEMGFNVVANELIKIEHSNQVAIDDIYLFGEERAILDNKLKLNEKYYLLIQGVKGFKDNAGKVSIGMSVHAKDKTGSVLLNAADLFGDEEFDKEALETQLSANFKFTETKFTNPIACEVVVWDKKSDAKITTTFDVVVE